QVLVDVGAESARHILSGRADALLVAVALEPLLVTDEEKLADGQTDRRPEEVRPTRIFPLHVLDQPLGLAPRPLRKVDREHAHLHVLKELLEGGKRRAWK